MRGLGATSLKSIYKRLDDVIPSVTVTKHNKQSETLEQSENLEEMGAERPEILVCKIGLPKFQSPSSHDSLLTFSNIF